MSDNNYDKENDRRTTGSPTFGRRSILENIPLAWKVAVAMFAVFTLGGTVFLGFNTFMSVPARLEMQESRLVRIEAGVSVNASNAQSLNRILAYLVCREEAKEKQGFAAAADSKTLSKLDFSQCTRYLTGQERVPNELVPLP